MKKESAQGFQEIAKQYGLDNYPKDEYTQAVFKEFRKYGTKLLKIANFEDMQKRGISLQQDVKELMAKKPKFESHLASLQRALDIYASVYSPKAVAKAAAKGDDMLMSIAQLLVLGKVSQEGDKLNPNPLANVETNLTLITGLFKDLTSIRPNLESSVADEVSQAIKALRKLCEKSTEELEGHKVTGAQLSQALTKAYEASSANKFRLELKVELAQPLPTTPPPGLLPEPKKDVGVSTPRSLLEEAEMPPDPAKAMPVSFLVADATQEEAKKPKEEAPAETEEASTGEQRRYYERYPSRRRGRRPRGRGYTYVKREGY